MGIDDRPDHLDDDRSRSPTTLGAFSFVWLDLIRGLRLAWRVLCVLCVIPACTWLRSLWLTGHICSLPVIFSIHRQIGQRLVCSVLLIARFGHYGTQDDRQGAMRSS